MSPAQIRDRLDQRFQLLTGGTRGAQARHQTLRHAVKWSYDLLPEADRHHLTDLDHQLRPPYREHHIGNTQRQQQHQRVSFRVQQRSEQAGVGDRSRCELGMTGCSRRR